MNTNNTLLTVITTTYNRCKLLKECYLSLKNQTSKNFQWLIVDDGSTDDTRTVIEEIKSNENEFLIDYVYKKNGGKHTALNASHTYIKGKYVVILDSDDKLIDAAVETILKEWKKYDDNDSVGQVIFLKGYAENDPICYVENENVVVDTLTEPRLGKTGRDCCDSYRTSLFVKHPFPEFEGEKFIGEGSAFFFIELESKGVYVNKVIYICSYREDGLTKAGKKMRIQNPLGGMYNSRVYMNKRLPLKTRVKKGMLYNCYSKFAHISFAKAIKENEYKLLTLATYIPGFVLYCYWKKKYL